MHFSLPKMCTSVLAKSFVLFLAKILHLSFSPFELRWVHTFHCQKRCTFRNRSYTVVLERQLGKMASWAHVSSNERTWVKFYGNSHGNTKWRFRARALRTSSWQKSLHLAFDQGRGHCSPGISYFGKVSTKRKKQFMHQLIEDKGSSDGGCDRVRLRLQCLAFAARPSPSIVVPGARPGREQPARNTTSTPCDRSGQVGKGRWHSTCPGKNYG